jgi:hypothetical protein
VPGSVLVLSKLLPAGNDHPVTRSTAKLSLDCPCGYVLLDAVQHRTAKIGIASYSG